MIETKDGQVFRDGALVGVVEGDALIVAEKLHHKTVALIEKETGLKVAVSTGAIAAVAQLVADSKPSESPKPTGNPADLSEEPEPPQDHRGDKTPAYVAWLFKNRPEEAATRYANRKVARPEF